MAPPETARKIMKPEINTETAETVQTGGDHAVVQERFVRPLPAVGDYVLATKYGDGHPQDHWCVGFYAGLTNPEKYDPPRYDVVDGEGKNFRGNGFRRIKKITPERGAWMLKHAKDIELSGRSVWRFARCSMLDESSAERDQDGVYPSRALRGGKSHPHGDDRMAANRPTTGRHAASAISGER
jgi:hypothetical protein